MKDNQIAIANVGNALDSCSKENPMELSFLHEKYGKFTLVVCDTTSVWKLHQRKELLGFELLWKLLRKQPDVYIVFDYDVKC